MSLYYKQLLYVHAEHKHKSLQNNFHIDEKTYNQIKSDYDNNPKIKKLFKENDKITQEQAFYLCQLYIMRKYAFDNLENYQQYDTIIEKIWNLDLDTVFDQNERNEIITSWNKIKDKLFISLQISNDEFIHYMNVKQSNYEKLDKLYIRS